MSILSPWYVARPWRLGRRVALELGIIARPAQAEVTLPFGARIQVEPHRCIGGSLYTTGTYDLAVAEVAFRLARDRLSVVDAGANIGYMTLVMAGAISPRGRCHAFEPVPELYRKLERNCGAALNPSIAPRIITHQLALSNRDGSATLSLPPGSNEGLATLELASAASLTVEVRCARLEACLGAEAEICLLKLDVEGHELCVLEGALSFLRQGLLRHIIFEDHSGLDSPVSRFLRSFGFEIFLLSQGILGPRIVPQGRVNELPSRNAPSWLATRDTGDAMKRIRSPGWRVLQSSCKI